MCSFSFSRDFCRIAFSGVFRLQFHNCSFRKDNVIRKIWCFLGARKCIQYKKAIFEGWKCWFLISILWLMFFHQLFENLAKIYSFLFMWSCSGLYICRVHTMFLVVFITIAIARHKFWCRVSLRAIFFYASYCPNLRSVENWFLPLSSSSLMARRQPGFSLLARVIWICNFALQVVAVSITHAIFYLFDRRGAIFTEVVSAYV